MRQETLIKISAIQDAISAWNSGNIGSLMSLFSEDVAYCSPMVADEAGSKWLQGTQEVAAHLLTLRARYAKLDLFDVMGGAGFLNLILDYGGGRISLLMELSDGQQARRVIVCHSTGPDLRSS